MRRVAGPLWVCAMLVLLIPTARAAELLTNDAIASMVKAGLSDQLVLEKIRISQPAFDLSTQAIVRLKEAGVSETVIKAMVETAAASPAPAPPTAEAMAQQTQQAIALYHQGKVVEAEAAFDRLLAEKPGDEPLKVWKALAILEQARALKEADKSGYKPLVVKAYTILQPLGRRIPDDPDWNFAMAKAYWLNDRPTWAGRAAKTALKLRPNFVEPVVLLGDLAYDSDAQDLAMPAGSPQRQNAVMWPGVSARKEYDKALAMPDVSAALQAEIQYKLGKVAADVQKKPAVAREHWERAVAADPTCRYGVMAGQKLRGAPGK